MTRNRECEAPYHAKNCPCPNCEKTTCRGCWETNVDHFTPKSVAKIWGLKPKEYNRKENKQFLSLECHVEKDRTTPIRKMLAKRQKNGEFISLDKYLKAVNKRESSM